METTGVFLCPVPVRQIEALGLALYDTRVSASNEESGAVTTPAYQIRAIH